MLTTRPHIDRAAILRRAWQVARSNAADSSFPGHRVSPRTWIARAMKWAWQEAHEAAAHIASPAFAAAADALDNAIFAHAFACGVNQTADSAALIALRAERKQLNQTMGV